MKLLNSLLLAAALVPCIIRAQDLGTAKVDAAKRTLQAFQTDKSWRSLVRAFELACRIPEQPRLGDWHNQRETKLALLLSVFVAADAAIDPKFNLEDRPVTHVPPPPGFIPPRTGYGSGLPASEISDPEIRRQYEEAIAKNKEKSEYYMQQQQLRAVREQCLAHVGVFINRAFATKERAEAENAIETTVSDPKLKASLKEALEAETKRK